MNALFNSLKWNQLIAFEAVARHLHFRKAAEELGIAQPALTRRISDLEEILGYPLFERSTRTVSLLAQGQMLKDYLPKLFDDFDSALAKAKSAALGKAGLLRIGIVGTPAMGFIHQPVLNFRKAYPDYEVSLIEASSTAITQRLVNKTLDCGFFLNSLTHPQLKCRTIAHDPLGVAVSHEHCLAKSRKLSLRQLADEPIILFARERNPALFDSVRSGIPGFASDQLLEASSRQVAIMMAASGLGIAIIAESMRSCCPESVRYIPLSNKALGTDIVMGWLPSKSNVLGDFI